ncbi:MAG: polyprenyl synthetase family protein [Bacteroidaceae bacterium]|nr:polyprenyl synthetase family protein [Bacteroidaceae bacterium]
MLHDIQTPIADDLRRYADVFRQSLRADNELLAAALAHVTRRLGKMMRPTLVLLCARQGANGVTPEVLHAAAGLEMLHTASLVHDDVVDESDMRRGQRSVNALFDNKAAVLVGDFMTSKALAELALTHSLPVVERTAWLGQTLADGELEQLSNTHLTTFDEAAYFSVIAKKTAALFSTCACVGALLGGADDATRATLERYGHLVGLCFQMRDDIFDFDETLNVGKPKGNDMLEGKLTLPVVHAVATAADADTAATYFRRLALKVRAQEASRLEIQELVDFTIRRGGVAYAEQRMRQLRDEAVGLLATLPASDVTTALCRYIDFVVERTS